jgi:hypothetical protein
MWWGYGGTHCFRASCLELVLWSVSGITHTCLIVLCSYANCPWIWDISHFALFLVTVFLLLWIHFYWECSGSLTSSVAGCCSRCMFPWLQCSSCLFLVIVVLLSVCVRGSLEKKKERDFHIILRKYRDRMFHDEVSFYCKLYKNWRLADYVGADLLMKILNFTHKQFWKYAPKM